MPAPGIVTAAEIRLPEWIAEMKQPPLAATDQACMALAIALARENVARQTGGPFGAVIRAESSGKVISLGVNLALATGNPALHAELVAISFAGPLSGGATLFTSCEPCIMCLGASHWAEIRRIVSAALREDAEAVGFSEGAGCGELKAEMAARGVEFESGMMRVEAATVLRAYAASGAPIYGPKSGR